MKRFRNILYVAHPSGVVLKAFHHAVGLAERNDARLTVLQVIEKIPPYLNRLTPFMLRQIRLEEHKAALNRLCEWVKGRVKTEAKLVEGKPFLEVIRDVLRNERDLVVKSAEGGDGAMTRLFGTTDMHLLRKCPCPVWLIKSTELTPFRRIMAAVDFNELDPTDPDSTEPLNRKILELAGSLAFLAQSELHVVHAWSPVGESHLRGTGMTTEEVASYLKDIRMIHRRWFDRLMRKAKKWIGPEEYQAIKPKTHLPNGDAREVIPDIARTLGVDLIVMGTVARTGIPGLFIGNTAESILSGIDCSVLAVKPEGFVTPIKLEE